MKINWARKLSSRKFWGLIMALIVAIGVLIGIPESEVAKILAVVGAFSSIIIYILAEAYVDGKAVVPKE